MVRKLDFGTATVNPIVTPMSVVPLVVPTSQNLPAKAGPAQQPFTMGEIATFGNDKIEAISAVATTINQSARAADLDEVGKLVGDVLVVAQGYDPTKIKEGGGLFGMFKGKAQAFKNRFTTVDTQINEMKAQLVRHQQQIMMRIPQMEQLAKDIEARHIAMGETVQFALGRIEWMKMNPPAVIPGDTFSAQQLDTWNQVIAMAEKRTDDLRRMQLLAEQQVPRINIMITNAVQLHQKLHDIITLVIPSWQTLLAEYTMQLGIKKTGEMADKVTDSFNAAQVATAKLGHANAVQIAKTMQRSTADMDTLKQVQQNLEQTLTETRQIAAEGARRREQERPELEAMSQQLQKLLANQPQAIV